MLRCCCCRYAVASRVQKGQRDERAKERDAMRAEIARLEELLADPKKVPCAVTAAAAAAASCYLSNGGPWVRAGVC